MDLELIPIAMALIFEHLVAYGSAHQPGHAEQVEDHPERSIPEVVMGTTMGPWPMIHGHLNQPTAGTQKKRSEKTMRPREQGQPQCHGSWKNAHGTPGVANGLAEHHVPYAIGPPADDSPRPG